MKKNILIVLLIIFSTNLVFSQTIKIYGTITDTENNAINEARIVTPDEKVISNSDKRGAYEITVSNRYKQLVFSKYTFKTYVYNIEKNKTSIHLDIILDEDNLIDTIAIKASKLNSTGISHVDARIADRFVSASESIEDLVVSASMGATGSRNSMSQQYSVRGGSFDENIIYVNGIEVYRPQLIRSGQQEGLSFINPNMVSSIKFSAGGFSAKYGDKMSSILDIKYKRPREFGAGITASMLGGSVFLQGISKGGRFSHISGFRYKTNQYMLKGLETKGEYRPTFLDFQTYLSYYFNNHFDISFLGNIADNKFNFVPESRETHFGTIQRAYGLFIAFQGQEIDRFSSYTGALTANYHPSKRLNYSFSLSSFQALESETFDIIGAYSLNELSRDLSTENAGDSILNLGIGAFMRHARNSLFIYGYSLNHKGFFDIENHNFSWGLKYKYENIDDNLDEWEVLDSAGYSIPYNGNILSLKKNIKAHNTLITKRYSAYLQDKFSFELANLDFEFLGGARINYNTYNKQWLFSPRGSLAFRPSSSNSTIYRFSSGIYYQPPFYREMRLFSGDIIQGSKAQKSIHFVLGNEFQFIAIDRLFKLTTEIYYKKLENIIPFEVDNVRVKYYANQRANGYANGIDMKLSGQFVQGVESWINISVMKTEEDIYDIGNGEDDGYGFIPRASDQRVSASLFLQDYVPMFHNFKAHLNLVYGTAFHFGPPETARYKATGHSPDYKRVDLGASAVILKEGKKSKNKILKHFKSIWLTVEVFNLLAVDNTISYTWVSVVPNSAVPFSGVYDQYAVSNHLTDRRFNFKISIKF